MRKIATYILAAAALCLASCISLEDGFIPAQEGQKMSVMASVADFSSVNIGTKALEEEESEVKELTMIVFDSEGNIVAEPVNLSGGNSVFMIDTQNATIMDENGLPINMNKEGHDASVATEYQAKLNECTIYMVANCWEVLKKETINNVSDLLTVDIQVEKIGIPDQGIPMIGFKGGFDLSIDRTSTASTVADIVMDKLYAKVNVRFQINADQVINTPSFTLSGWTVSNIPANVRLGEPAAGAETANATGDVLATTKSSTTLSYGVQTITHSESAANPDYFQFTFYVPEHRVNPKGSVTYPTGMPDTEKQRYKPLLCTDSQKPMYVTVKGSYTDHHNQVKEVTYSLYLGQNNWNDFHINRNQELNNIITIKGLTNSKGADEDPDNTITDNISVDHRVDVADNGFSISMEREALLDSHFEVRPMDVFVSNGGKVVLTVNGDWLRIEKSYGGVAANNSSTNATYIQNVGVRKYFTTNLVTDELSSDPITINAGENSRIWLYFDENANVYDKTIEDSPMYRDITLTVDYYADANSDVVTKSQPFSFRQMNLWRVRNADNTRYYDIEYHEEYLYNYVSNDNYGKTTDGMAWGLNGIQLSNLYNSAFTTESSGFIAEIMDYFGGFKELINKGIKNTSANPYYDFYLTRDSEALDLLVDPTGEKGVVINDFKGFEFNQQIVATLLNIGINSTNETEKKIVELNVMLNQDPVSAISYCYNKNRRNPDGTISPVNQKWFLPSIDQIEEITMAGYQDFEVFQDKLYWSCQPAFDHNTISVRSLSGSTASGNYMEDDIDRARATKIAVDENGNPSNVSSSVTGISNTLNIRTFFTDIRSASVTPTGNVINYSLHPGNLDRMEAKNRIRCVRESGPLPQSSTN